MNVVGTEIFFPRARDAFRALEKPSTDDERLMATYIEYLLV